MKKMVIMALLCFGIGNAFSQLKTATVIVDPGTLKTGKMWGRLGDEDVIYGKKGKDGKVTFVFPAGLPGSANIGIDSPRKAQLFLFLEAGDKVTVKTDFDKKTTFSGKGAANCQVLTQAMNAYMKAGTNVNVDGKSIIEMLAIQKAIDQTPIDVLEANKAKVTPVMYNDQLMTFKIGQLTYQMILPNALSSGYKKKFSECVPPGFWDYDKVIPIDESLLKYDSYKRYITGMYPAWLRYRDFYQRGVLDSTSALTEEQKRMYEYLMAEKYLPGKLRTLAMNALMGRLMDAAKDVKSVRPMLDEYLSKYATPAEKTELETLYTKILTLAAGAIPPPFEMKDLNGKTVSLSDYAGKVIFVDFWASWCAPCRGEMRNGSPKLHEQFKDNKDVVFFYVSIDDNEVKWKKAIEEDKIEGVHALSVGGMKSKAAKAFNVSGVPRYVIIGKDGKIFDNDAPRPSQEASARKINEALGK